MKKAILLTTYGAGGRRGQDARMLFDALVRRRHPEATVRWAFTSDLMRGRLAGERLKTDSVYKALRRLGFERYAQVALQPMHVIPGAEYEELKEEVALAARDGTLEISLGAPLLDFTNDPESVVRCAYALLAHTPLERAPGEAVVWVGHGNPAHAGEDNYARLHEAVQNAVANSQNFPGEDKGLIHVVTLQGTLTDRGTDEDGTAISGVLKDLMPVLYAKKARVIWLVPLLSILGKHALVELGGEGPSSWRSVLTRAGFDCRPVFKGLAECEGFLDIWLRNLDQAMQALGYSI